VNNILRVISMLFSNSCSFKLYTRNEDAGVRFFQEITMSQRIEQLRSPHMRKDTVY
jgi:hypothetical protein